MSPSRTESGGRGRAGWRRTRSGSASTPVSEAWASVRGRLSTWPLASALRRVGASDRFRRQGEAWHRSLLHRAETDNGRRPSLLLSMIPVAAADACSCTRSEISSTLVSRLAARPVMVARVVSARRNADSGDQPDEVQALEGRQPSPAEAVGCPVTARGTPLEPKPTHRPIDCQRSTFRGCPRSSGS